MKEIINELRMPWLTLKQKAIVWYFTVSFCLIGSLSEASFWFLLAVVANFANAARLIRKVPLPESEKDV